MKVMMSDKRTSVSAPDKAGKYREYFYGSKQYINKSSQGLPQKSSHGLGRKSSFKISDTKGRKFSGNCMRRYVLPRREADLRITRRARTRAASPRSLLEPFFTVLHMGGDPKRGVRPTDNLSKATSHSLSSHLYIYIYIYIYVYMYT